MRCYSVVGVVRIRLLYESWRTYTGGCYTVSIICRSSAVIWYWAINRVIIACNEFLLLGYVVTWRRVFGGLKRLLNVPNKWENRRNRAGKE